MTHSEPPAETGHAHSSDTERPGPLAWVLLLPVHLYRLVLSPLLGQNCRYFPTCSSYAVAALTRHGALKGSLLAAWRLLRCNPWSLGGSDRVPARGRWRPDPYVAPPGDDEDTAGRPTRGDMPGGATAERRLGRGVSADARDVKES